MKAKRNIIINSAIFYISAFLITTMIHELAHAFSGMISNSSPVLHHNYVEHFSYNHLTVFQQLAIALAGPLISLIQGLVAGWVFLKSKRNKPVHLFLLWLSVLGFNNFFGYLMTGPVFNTGDIGKAFLLWELPMLFQVIIAVFGALILLYIAYKLTQAFLAFSYEKKWTEDGKSRQAFSFSIIILPWIIGSICITILYLPIIALVSIIYPIMSGMVLIFPWKNAYGVKNLKPSDNDQLGSLSISSIIILILLILIFKFVLAPGVDL